MIGANGKENSQLKVASRKAWLHVGKLDDTTTTDDVIVYLQQDGIEGEIICEALETKGRNKAFIIGFNFEDLKKTDDPNFWPKYVLVRPFRFRRAEQQGVLLRQQNDGI